MCSRLDADKAAIKKSMNINVDAADDDFLSAAKWGELFPTDPILVIGFGDEPTVRHWGLKPDWAERPIINAKAEEAAGKKTFQPLLASRCIVPATGYYEWRLEDGKKIKTLIATDGVMPMAGFITPDACVVLTCAPSPALAHIHHRMPAILDTCDVTAWLDPQMDFATLRPVLKPSLRAFRIADAAPPAPRPAKPRPEPRQASLF
jgi:putative SOS response-associated peptidase YedK